MELKRNQDGSIKGVSTMGDFIGPSANESESLYDTDHIPNSLPEGVQKLFLKKQSEAI